MTEQQAIDRLIKVTENVLARTNWFERAILDDKRRESLQSAEEAVNILKNRNNKKELQELDYDTVEDIYYTCKNLVEGVGIRQDFVFNLIADLHNTAEEELKRKSQEETNAESEI